MTEPDDGIVLVTLDRPNRLNAMTATITRLKAAQDAASLRLSIQPQSQPIRD